MIRRIFMEWRAMPRYMHLLAALLIFGLIIGAYRMVVGLGDTTNLTNSYPWGIWISFDLAMVALSGGAFTLAALVYVFQFESLHAAVRPTVLTGLLGYSSVMVVLLFDLGRWDHFYNVFLHPNFTSALLEVSWCITAYTLILFYELSPVLLENSPWRRFIPTIKKLVMPFVITGVTLSTMHQSSLGTLFVIMSPRLDPIWHSMLLPVFFFVSSLAAGISLVVAGANLSYWMFGRSMQPKVLAKLTWFIPWILMFYLVLKFGELFFTGEIELPFEGGPFVVLFWLEIIVGAVIPIVLFSFSGVRNSRIASLIGAFLIMAGAVLNRFNVSWFALEPQNGSVYTPHWMEVAILVAIVSGVILVYSLIARYFPVYGETVQYRRSPNDPTKLEEVPGIHHAHGD